LEDHEETRGLALTYEPLARSEPHIRHGVCQSSPFGFVKTRKDFGLPQLFWTKNGKRLRASIDNLEFLYSRMLSTKPMPRASDTVLPAS
jgi:hypothetical protein